MFNYLANTGLSTHVYMFGKIAATSQPYHQPLLLT